MKMNISDKHAKRSRKTYIFIKEMRKNSMIHDSKLPCLKSKLVK